MDLSEVNLSDIESLRSNVAWRWLNFEWNEILAELEATLVSEDYPAVYRTQGRVSAIAEFLGTINKVEEELKSGI